MPVRIKRPALACCAALAALSGAVVAAEAKFTPDPLVATELPAKPGLHWVWVNDIVFHHMADGKSFLVDGDTGRMLGMLSTGFGQNGVALPGDGTILSPEAYFSRGTRGKRTDVLTIYDGRKLSPIAEVEIPPKRASAMPEAAIARPLDDGRFMLVYNFTPAQSISVVDLKTRKFVGEIDIAGCALIYPTGPRAFFSLCGDGTALVIQLDDSGKQKARSRTAKLFDPVKDPVTEKAVRDGNTWYFVTFAGDVVPIDIGTAGVKALPRWSLLDAADRKASWRPGGIQHLALHAGTHRLYSLMHVGGANTHKDPGTEVWVYDLAAKRRVQRIALVDPATAIAVTRDAKPVLFAIFFFAPKLDVYDPAAGKRLRSIAEIGFTPTWLVTY